MTGIAIYMEGGGDGAAGKQALRQGMDAFLRELKTLVRARGRRWQLVPCGGRKEAFDAFRREHASGKWAIVVLLIDAEGPVAGKSCAYLAARESWPMDAFSDDVVHLMVQTMEAWIIADPDAPSDYYRQNFRKSALPRTQNLETVAKADIAAKLRQATKDTQKGEYHKIRHASDLLQRIAPQKVRERCPGCQSMFTALEAGIREL